ncbi:MAG TPA: hypothetical protein VL463_21355 [Kofleriaceae bacterium]|nr:hypothetical protein [Kofleriaceae bacterium]
MALAAVPSAAFAQDEGGTGDGSGGTTDVSNAGGTATTTAGDQMAATGSGPAIFKHGTMGLSLPISLFTIDLAGLGGTTTPAVHPVNILMFQDNANALDLILGVNLAVTPDGVDQAGNPVAGATTFGFAAGLGYRMYKHHSERIHTFLEPRAFIGVNDVSSFADVLTLSVGANLGAEAMFTEWFSVSGTIGASADFSQKFKDINVGTFTGGLSANFYWD